MPQPPRSAVVQHSHANRQSRAAVTGPNIQAIAAHVREHIGQPEYVYHEIASTLVHVDVHIVPPAPKRKFFSLVTSGMSDLPMNVPTTIQCPRFVELMMCLPEDWPLPLKRSDWSGLDERILWPLQLLRTLARFPHENGTWLGFGHTIVNNNPPQAYAANTRMCAALLAYPVTPKPPFRQLRIDDRMSIAFLSVIPLYAQELAYKLEHGAKALAERLGSRGIGEVMVPNRNNVCRRWWWPF